MSNFCIILSHKNEIKFSDRDKDVYYAALSSSFKDTNGDLPLISSAFGVAKSVSVKCTLESVRYNKKIYEPCLLEFVVTVDIIGNVDNTINRFNNLFIRGRVSVIEDLADATKAEASNEVTIIKNYVICVIIPKDDTSEASHMTFVVKAYSPDKALDIKSYCETFYGKKLTDIIDNKLKEGSGTFKDFGITYSFSNSGLTYKSGSNDVEFNMPYLVQYNETFYQFLIRVANRCNKAVYFEDGTFYIGDRSGSNYTRANLTGAIIEYPDTYDYGDSKFSPGLFAANYCVGDSSISDLSENDELIDNSQSYKIVDKDNYTATDDILTDEIREISLLGYTCQGDSLTNVMANWLEKEAEYSNARDWIKKDIEDDWTRKYGPVTKHNDTLPGSETKSPLMSTWYKEKVAIQKKGEKDKRVFIFENHANKFLLGDTFNNTHSVIEIMGDWSYEMVVGPDEGDVKPEPQPCVANKIVVTAMKKGSTPYLGEKRIRRATPQKAVVAQVNDPLRMGRIRVKFPWDYRENLSPWIRVSTAAAYDGGGLLFTPAVNDEAMIDFEDGNIERPFVTGFVHTKAHKPYLGSRTYNKHACMYTTMKGDGEDDNNDYSSCTITNRTGQSISLENGVNGNNFYKGMTPLGGVMVATDFKPAGSDDRENTFSDDKKLGGCITLSDGYGVCTIKSDTGNRKISLESALGSVELSAYTGVTVSCPNGDIKLKGKNITLEAGNNVNIKAGGNKSGLGCYTTVNGIVSNVVGKCLELTDALIAYNTGSTAIKGFFDVSFARTVFETVLRPLEGTAIIKTPGVVILSGYKGGDASDYLRWKIGDTEADHEASMKALSGFSGWGNLGTKIHKERYGDTDGVKDNKSLGHGGWEKLGEGLGTGLLDGLTDYVGIDSIGNFLASIQEEYLNLRNGAAYAGTEQIHGGVWAAKGTTLNDVKELV